MAGKALLSLHICVTICENEMIKCIIFYQIYHKVINKVVGANVRLYIHSNSCKFLYILNSFTRCKNRLLEIIPKLSELLCIYTNAAGLIINTSNIGIWLDGIQDTKVWLTQRIIINSSEKSFIIYLLCLRFLLQCIYNMGL